MQDLTIMLEILSHRISYILYMLFIFIEFKVIGMHPAFNTAEFNFTPLATAFF